MTLNGYLALAICEYDIAHEIDELGNVVRYTSFWFPQ